MTFAAIRTQRHIVDALQAAVAKGEYGSAYLLSGPDQSDAPAIVSALAQALTCENTNTGEWAAGDGCGECVNCTDIERGRSFDVFTLDAARHGGIEDIRDLEAKFALGFPWRIKVYSITNIDRLTTGAENGLCRLLEGSPAGLVMVLTTTDPHRSVPTIRSRCQHFELEPTPQHSTLTAALDLLEDLADAVPCEVTKIYCNAHGRRLWRNGDEMCSVGKAAALLRQLGRWKESE